MSQGISLIVCCHNSAARLPETLSHLGAQRGIAPSRFEVIVVDNGSTDATAEIAPQRWSLLQRPAGPLRVIKEPKLGLMNARLAGIAAARFPILSFIDDDNRIDPYWCARLEVLMRQYPNVGLIGGLGHAVFDAGAEEPFWFERFQRGFAVGPQAAGEGMQQGWRDSFYGAGLTLRREAVQGILARGFAPVLTGRSGTGLGAGEDSELCLALALDGWDLWYEPRLTFGHLMTTGRLNTEYLLRLYEGFGFASVALDAYVVVARFGRHAPPWLTRGAFAVKHAATCVRLLKTKLRRGVQLGGELERVANEVDRAYLAGRLRGIAELGADLPGMVERIVGWLDRPAEGGTPGLSLRRAELGG